MRLGVLGLGLLVVGCEAGQPAAGPGAPGPTEVCRTELRPMMSPVPIGVPVVGWLRMVPVRVCEPAGPKPP